MNFVKSFRRKEYKVIKLFKVVNLELAQDLKIHSFINRCLDFIFENEKILSESYEINYGIKEWKTKKGLEKGISGLKSKDIVSLLAYFNNSKTSLTFINDILNHDNPPNKSIVNLEIAIENSETLEFNKISDFIKNLHSIFNYDYGYITHLKDNYDFHSEVKESKSLFVTKVSVGENDINRDINSLGINSGFLKGVYSINILNESHSSNPEIDHLIEKFGAKEKITEELFMWKLNKEEKTKVEERLSKTKFLI